MKVSFKNIRTFTNEGTILFHILSFLLITVAIILGGKFVFSAVQNGATTEVWLYFWGTAWFACLATAIFFSYQANIATNLRDKIMGFIGVFAGSAGWVLCIIIPMMLI